MTRAANSWILTYFSSFFSWGVLAFVLLLAIVYFLPFSKQIIGGKEAKPLLSKWKWFSITLCTTIATGILFWGTAEPLFHFHQPPTDLQLNAGSREAATFAMSTMFMHWTISPYAIYTLAALVFSFTFYNLKRPFEVSATLYPLLGKYSCGWIGHVVDIVCLYGLVAGMAASLGAGILTIAGGLQKLFEVEQTAFLLGVIAVVIVVTFVISASSGLMKGIRILSDYNIKAFILLAIFFFIFGASLYLMQLGFDGFVQYFVHFLPRSVNWNNELGQEWFQSWTVFNWANWLAWAPITALFLGRLGRGYSIRAFIRYEPDLSIHLWRIVDDDF